MQEKKQPLLSICIPTYNRCEVLDETLFILFSNPDFDNDLIEVLVSDNCSIDNTFAVVKKYPLVKYYTTEENIEDANFIFVIEKANGLYIRLFNDTIRFNEGKLKQMLEIIQTHHKEEKNLFFFNNMFLNKNCKKNIANKKDFITTVSFHTTWIVNFGCWKKDFELIAEKNKFVKTHFLQVDWFYKLVENQKNSIIYFENWFFVKKIKKGGYNIFDIFINKYLYLIRIQNMGYYFYKVEKYRLFYYFVLDWYITLFINKKKEYFFSTTNALKIIFRYYWYEPYFLILALWKLLLKSIQFLIIKIIGKNSIKKLKKIILKQL